MAPNLSRARRRMEQHMRSTCEIRRPTRVSNGRGGAADGFEIVYTGKCLIERRGTLPWEREFYFRQEGRSDIMAYLPHGTDVKVQDKIFEAGVEYEVLGDPPPLTHQVAQIVPLRGT